jgi:uncharacterized protein
MDYQFSFDKDNLPHVQFSIEHKAFEAWFNEELSNDVDKIEGLLDIIDQLETSVIQNKIFRNLESELHLDREEVELVNAASKYQDPEAEELDEFDEGYSFYNVEANAGCGLEDFKDCLESWFEFVRN